MLQRRFPSEGHCLTSCLSSILPRAVAPVFRPPFPHPNLFWCFNLFDSASYSTHSPFWLKYPLFLGAVYSSTRGLALVLCSFSLYFLFFSFYVLQFLFFLLSLFIFHYTTLPSFLHLTAASKFRNRFTLEHLLGFRLPLFPPSSAFTDSAGQRHVRSKPATAHTIPHQTVHLYVLGLILELLNPRRLDRQVFPKRR
jgi:hypothetical protein